MQSSLSPGQVDSGEPGGQARVRASELLDSSEACFSAVLGTATLSSAATALNTTRPLVHAEVQGLASLVEALLLHEGVVVVGREHDLDRLDTSLLAAIREMTSDGLYLMPLELLSERETRPEFESSLADLLKAVFGSNGPSASLRQLLEVVTPSRAKDDAIASLYGKFSGFVEQRGGSVVFKSDEAAQFLLGLADKGLTDPDVRFTSDYLFRAFLLATLASKLDGSFYTEGIRRFVQALIEKRLRRLAPGTIQRKFYQIANSLFHVARRPLYREVSRPWVYSLALSWAAATADHPSEIIDHVAQARPRFGEMRTNLAASHEIIVSEESPLSERARRHRIIVEQGAARLGEVLGALHLDQVRPAGFVSQVWRNAIDSLAGVPTYTAKSEPEVSTKITGSLLLALTRSGRTATQQVRAEALFLPILEMVREVVDAPGLLARLSRLLPLAEQTYCDALRLLDESAVDTEGVAAEEG